MVGGGGELGLLHPVNHDAYTRAKRILSKNEEITHQQQL